jgi:C1A family cysteine protease
LEEGSRDVLTSFDPATVRDRHAAALVGYGPGHFLLRSSWGTDWGDGGYGRLADGYAADAVEESYGIVM